MKIRNGETPYKSSLRGRIVHDATILFHAQGIRAVKMDDIAASLSISKRTLYELFETKELLLEEVVRIHEEESKVFLADVVERSADVMDVLITLYHATVKELKEVSPLFLEDLHKYPKIVETIRRTHLERRKATDSFFSRGVEEGFFRADVNVDIFHRFSEAISQHVMSSLMYKDFPMNEIFRNMLLLMFRGMCTEKGIRRLDAFLQEPFRYQEGV